jgi:hypothetical protein
LYAFGDACAAGSEISHARRSGRQSNRISPPCRASRARQFFFTGRKGSGQTLKPGIYTGKVTVVRDGSTVAKSEMMKMVTLE